MRILKRILLAIMVMCLCASAGISLAFAEGESSAEGYTGTRYTVTGGAVGGQPLWFGNSTPVNYAEAGTEVNIEYTVKTNAMSGDGISGLCRVFKELGNCWFNTASVSYCGWNEGYNRRRSGYRHHVGVEYDSHLGDLWRNGLFRHRYSQFCGNVRVRQRCDIQPERYESRNNE